MRNIAEIIKDDRNGKPLSQTERQIAVAYIQGKYDAVMKLKIGKSSNVNEVLDKIRAEIIEKYWDCDICKWEIDYKPHYAIRGDINDILQILDKYKVEVEPQ